MKLGGIFLSILFGIQALAVTPEKLIITTPQGAREFYLYAPAKPQALVVMLHGCKTSALEFDEGTEMSKYVKSHQIAVLYPEQSPIANYDRCWNWFWGTEISIISSGVSQIQKRFHLPREKTYLMGMSAGAAQAAILANCNRDLFGKVLLHSGLQFLAATSLEQANEALQKGSFTDSGSAAIRGLACNGSLKPVEFMVVHGTKDERVRPINGVQAAEELLKLDQLIALKNHGSTAATSETSIVPSQGTKLGYSQQFFFIGGRYAGSFLEIDGLAHEWSGGNPRQPRNNPNGPSVVELFLGLK